MAKKEIDFDEELERLARKSNINIRKSEYSFENQIKKLDTEIDSIANKKIKEFEKNKELTSEYLSIDYTSGSIDRYREKLKKI
jgi:phage host-nuclease inhibitor protein Gam